MNRWNRFGSMVFVAAVLCVSFAGVSQAQSPYCNTPAAAIPDSAVSQSPGTALTNDLVVSDTQVLTDVNVSLDITHTWVGDLVVTLTKTSGPGSPVTVNLLTRPGCDNVGEPDTANSACGFGCSGDNVLATLDDGGADGDLLASCGAGLNAGPYLPQTGPLSGLNGISADGTWQLNVTDWGLGDTGTLNGWCLITTPVPVELMSFQVE